MYIYRIDYTVLKKMFNLKCFIQTAKLNLNAMCYTALHVFKISVFIKRNAFNTIND